jgi:hypothetical protein
LVVGSNPTRGANENFATFAVVFLFFSIDGTPIFKPIAGSILSEILYNERRTLRRSRMENGKQLSPEEISELRSRYAWAFAANLDYTQHTGGLKTTKVRPCYPISVSINP